MLTLLGSLLGFVSSAFPDLLKLWQDKQDRKHELKILDRQMEQMRLGHSQRLEAIDVAADIAESKALYTHANQPSGVTQLSWTSWRSPATSLVGKRPGVPVPALATTSPTSRSPTAADSRSQQSA